MIDVTTAWKRIKRSYENNLPEYRGILKKHYPDFVYDKNPSDLKGNIPVFTFHSVEQERFEKQMFFLRENDYRTLNADQLYECLTGTKPIPERPVVITFDDGPAGLWTTAYPVLKRYGFQAVCFIVPGLIREEPAQNTIGNNSLCSWREIKVMHEDGTIDFQSHTMYHSLIFVSSEIDDFVHPTYYRYGNNFNIPIYKNGNTDNILRDAGNGMPIYKNASRYSGKNRYFDDENLRNLCMEHVIENGGDSYFNKCGWRKKLLCVVNQYGEKHGNTGHYESDEEKRDVLFKDLSDSKRTIEGRLKSKTVNHFCYPWWVGCELSVELSKKAGYLTNFWGLIPGRRTTNRVGDDPYRIGRLIEDDFVLRLPGVGRESLSNIIAGKLLSGGKSFRRKMY